MDSIHILPEQVINQIAAGEVVERPASIVKELLENSIDAGATHISIYLRNGGKSLIEIIDNGSGIASSEIKKAFLRHATSKITELSDLDRLVSLGFRGEALASIASVSMVTVETSTTVSAPEGKNLVLNHGEIVEEAIISRQQGTTIRVEHLFAKVPARRKFLKSDRQELAAITRLVQEIALTFPHIHFELFHENKELLNAPPETLLLERFYQIMSKELAGKMYSVHAEDSVLSADMVISSPVIKRTNRSQQMISINGRIIQDFRLNKIISDAYQGFLLSNEFPIFFIHLKVAPDSVDVNVHPRKSEVRFSDPDQVYSFLYRQIREFLSSQQFAVSPNYQSPTIAYPSSSYPSPSGHFVQQRQSTYYAQQFDLNAPTNPAPSVDVSATESLFVIPEAKPIRVLSQISNSYILAVDQDHLLLFDQHAAHERLLYEQFKQARLSHASQPLLVAIPFDVSAEQSIMLSERLDLYHALGIDLEQVSPSTWTITAIPAIVHSDQLDWAAILQNSLSETPDQSVKQNLEHLEDDMLHTMACKAAVKFNDALTIPELQRLIDDVAYLPGIYTCPHGRPFRLSMQFTEINHHFKRH
jgi:DNA mismatch repair protein MutL